ncbi:MAG: trigger factor [Spirochaetes bacterium RBG_16_49_21]|nr:MAG: trigger factor [Spirochaetes bacterium RBG_16_49_21]
MLNISEKKLENATIELRIDVPVEKVESAYTAVFDKLKNTVKIDGFRKGRAPLHIVENRFKKEADKEVAENLLTNTFIEAIQEKHLRPIGLPRYEFDVVFRDKPFTFKAIFEISPTVELGRYKGIAAEEAVCTITDADVEAEIDAVRERYAKINKKDDGAAVQNGDLVRLKVKRIDDVEQADLDKVEFKEYSIVAGKSKDESALDKHITGMIINEERNIDIKYPKSYYPDDLAGQKVTYHVVISEIGEIVLPELNEEFAKKVGYESIEEFTAKTREQLEKYVTGRARGDAKGEILKEIVEESRFDIPETMIANEMNELFLKAQESIGYRSDDMEKFAAAVGQDPEVFRNDLRERAARMIKTSLALMEIARKEELKIDENRFKEVIETIAKNNNKTAAEIEKIVAENDSRHNIESELLLDSAMEFIYKNAKIKGRKPVSLDEFLKNRGK